MNKEIHCYNFQQLGYFSNERKKKVVPRGKAIANYEAHMARGENDFDSDTILMMEITNDKFGSIDL